MSIRAILTLAVLWAVSLFIASSVVRAQAFPIVPLPDPRIVSGSDLGFRVEGMQNGVPVGRLVIRVDGQWIDARFGSIKVDPRITSR